MGLGTCTTTDNLLVQDSTLILCHKSILPIESCPPLIVPNSTIHYNRIAFNGRYTVDTNVSVHCHLGFVAEQDVTRQCDATGTWTGPPLICIGEKNVLSYLC